MGDDRDQQVARGCRRRPRDGELGHRPVRRSEGGAANRGRTPRRRGRRRIGLVRVEQVRATGIGRVVRQPVPVVVEAVGAGGRRRRRRRVGLVGVRGARAAGIGGEVDQPVTIVVEPVRARRRRRRRRRGPGRAVARRRARVRRGPSSHGQELPVVRRRMQGQLEDAVGVVQAHLAVRRDRLERVERITAGAGGDLPDPVGEVERSCGRLRREALVDVCVTGHDQVGAVVVEHLPEGAPRRRPGRPCAS